MTVASIHLKRISSVKKVLGGYFDVKIAYL